MGEDVLNSLFSLLLRSPGPKIPTRQPLRGMSEEQLGPPPPPPPTRRQALEERRDAVRAQGTPENPRPFLHEETQTRLDVLRDEQRRLPAGSPLARAYLSEFPRVGVDDPRVSVARPRPLTPEQRLKIETKLLEQLFTRPQR